MEFLKRIVAGPARHAISRITKNYHRVQVKAARDGVPWEAIVFFSTLALAGLSLALRLHRWARDRTYSGQWGEALQFERILVRCFAVPGSIWYWYDPYYPTDEEGRTLLKDCFDPSRGYAAQTSEFWIETHKPTIDAVEYWLRRLTHSN